MNVDQLLSLIDSLKRGWYSSPISYHKRKIEFITQSYRKSCLDELELYLKKHKGDSPVLALENFRNQMDSYALRCYGKDANIMFSVYYDVTTEVLDIIIEINEKRRTKNE